MDVPPMHPGPFSDELLVLQGDHRSAHVWEGELLAQTLRSRRVDDMWDFMKERDLHPCVVHRLRVTGFYRILEIGWLQLDWSLVTALIERWRPETHTFHLPIGVATITLQDVEVLYGLPVDRLPVALPQSMREMTREQYLDMLQQLTGFRPQDETTHSGASSISLTVIRQHLEICYWPKYSLPDGIADAVACRRGTGRFARLWSAACRGGCPDTAILVEMCLLEIGLQVPHTVTVVGIRFLPFGQMLYRT
ncbi:serine/threonine-protein phosphatase 7 long form homolog [Nicotiana tomentosiformis]|uniref:serine/threonine-protein phosphatase 7 long form homolog n=1 Tax=Nicotiana tomentosiformis TaxID=4098 RepID=UPI00388C83F4